MKNCCLLLLVAVFACSEKKNCEAENPVEISFASLEDSLPRISDKQQLIHFLTRRPGIRDFALHRQSYPNDSVFFDELYRRFTHPSMDTVLMDVKKVFGNGQALKQEFVNAFTRLQQIYPSFRPPKVETVLTGLETDIVAGDTLVIVCLDYFLGAKAKYRPNMHNYILRRYKKDFVVPSLILLWGTERYFNATNSQDKTVLSDMIAYGKAYYFAKKIMPCTPDSVLMGYSSKEMEGVQENENYIWKKLVEDEIFYKDDYRIKQKYILERPKTFEVSASCPGRIGAWTGWQIVKAYAQRHPNLTLPELMKISDANLIFKESKYKPD